MFFSTTVRGSDITVALPFNLPSLALHLADYLDQKNVSLFLKGAGMAAWLVYSD